MAMLTTIRPQSFDSVRRDLDQWFDRYFGPEGAADRNAWNAPASMWEDDSHVYLEIEMPGVAHDDVDITFEQGVLKVTAERKSVQENRNYWHQTRSYGKTQLAARLPETIDGDSIDAELKHGVLNIKLDKLPQAQPKKISVKASE